MKPIYLEMNYFGPHEHSIIDFRKLENSSIFLIGGDTGAGKSTIFDAMTYALFSTTTGDRDAKEMRSQFAQPNQPTKVIFYFEQNGKIYKVERTPEQWLENKRNTKSLTNRKPTASLAIVDDVNGMEIESLATLPRDVGSDIDDILKLTAEQFKKIILLPQNDFSEFLKSPTDEKEKILKKIFGTQIFTDFTIKLKARFDKAKTTNATYQSKLDNQYTSQIWTDEERTVLAEATNDQKNEILTANLKNRQSKLVSAQSAEKQATDEWEKANQSYQAATAIQKQFADLANNKKKYQTQIVDQADEFGTKQNHISELEWASPLKDVVRDLDNAQTNQRAIAESQKDVTKKLSLSKEQLDQAQTKITQLSSQKNDFDQKEQQSKKLTLLIPKVKQIEELRNNLAKVTPKLETIKQTVQKETDSLAKLQSEIETKNSDLVSVDDLQTKKDALTHEKDNLVDTLTPLENNLKSSEKDLRTTTHDLDELNNDFKIKSEQLNTAQVDYLAQKKNRQRLMIAQLQQELVDGEPCEVCGSTEHPYASHIEKADENELRKSMDAVEKSQKDFNSAESAVKLIQDNIDKTKSLLQKQQTAVDNDKAQLNSQYQKALTQTSVDLPKEYDLKSIKQSFQTEINKIDVQINAAQAVVKEIKQLEQAKADNQTKLNQSQIDLGKVDTQINTWQADLEKNLKDIPDEKTSSHELSIQKNDLDQAVTEYKDNLETAKASLHANEIKFSNNQTQLKDIDQQLQKANETIKQLSDKLNESLAATDAKTHNLETLESWIREISQNNLSKLQDEIVSYNKEKEILSNNISEMEKQLKDQVQPDLTTLNQQLSALREKQTAAIKLAGSANTAVTEAQKVLDEVKKILKQQGDFTKEYQAITGLYDVINGRGSDDTKLKLETFVVQNYLQQVLRYANEHFFGLLTGGRYTFILSDKASDNRSDHGLDINVIDSDTGHIRSTKTLSGGETFIAALSIALSLSEVVQSSSNGVKIDALFIDEGFGSLDETTLHNAMGALNRIGQNRMVGVISHVDSMKEAIGQQVLIKKLGNGHSSIELINK